jgi:hypothetical protein
VKSRERASKLDPFKAAITELLQQDPRANAPVIAQRLQPLGYEGGVTIIIRAPFPTPESRRPTWRFPNEIPIAGEPADVYSSLEKAHEALTRSTYPKLLFAGGIQVLSYRRLSPRALPRD